MEQNSEEFIKDIGILQSSIIRLKKSEVFSLIDFSKFEDLDSFAFRIYDCPHWYSWKDKTITSLLGLKVKITDQISNRLIKNGSLSVKIIFPQMEKDGKKINLEVVTYLYLGKPVYKYNYYTEGFCFGQRNLDFFTLCKNIKAILTNKPLTRKSQVNGFMQRLNSLSPNFNKSLDTD